MPPRRRSLHLRSLLLVPRPWCEAAEAKSPSVLLALCRITLIFCLLLLPLLPLPLPLSDCYAYVRLPSLKKIERTASAERDTYVCTSPAAWIRCAAVGQSAMNEQQQQPPTVRPRLQGLPHRPPPLHIQQRGAAAGPPRSPSSRGSLRGASPRTPLSSSPQHFGVGSRTPSPSISRTDSKRIS